MTSLPPPTGLARAVRWAARGAARRPKITIALWLLLVAGCVFAGVQAGTKQLTDAEAGVGESARAEARLEAAKLHDPAVESVLVRSADRGTTAAAAAALELRLHRIGQVRGVHGPDDGTGLSREGGRAALVRATLRGTDDDARAKGADAVAAAVAATRADHPGVSLQETGSASLNAAIDDVVSEDLKRAELISLPVTLAVLVVVFAALVAAVVPLLLGLTAVAGAMGLVGVLSHVAGVSDATGTLVVLIGLAVGVDYSLFYVRRERELRRAGLGPHAALDAAAATVGRAIVVSGLTVAVAMGGLLATGMSAFTSIALGTIAVVALAVLGSVTVLPAVLALLGDRVDRGRVPLLGRLRARRPAGAEPRGPSAWLARGVTRHPLASLVTAVSILGILAIPAADLNVADISSGADLPRDVPAVRAMHAVERAFPGSHDTVELVVTGRDLDGGAARARLDDAAHRASGITDGEGRSEVRVSADGRTALLAVPLPSGGEDHQRAIVSDLRDRAGALAAEVGPGTRVLVGGQAAGDADFASKLAERTPVVIGVVLVLAFLLLVAAFRSPALAASVIGLNLLSVLAAYGVLVAVFQHGVGEHLLGFTASGAIVAWLPLFAFVILFGLSMDYTVLVLERMREERRAGRSAAEAARRGIAATAGTVTGAALVMVAVFAIFATLRLLSMKQVGVGLAAAVLIDATLVRAIALPAVVTLLGERRWRVRPALGAGWNTDRYRPLAAADADGR